jgi:PTS system nitrogen regulatory IIA component
MNLTVRMIASMLNVTERKVLRWIRQDGLPAHRVADDFRFHREEVMQWATEHGIDLAVPEMPPSIPGVTVAPRLAGSLEAGGVYYDVPAASRDEMLRQVVLHMPLVDDLDRDMLFEVLLAREALGSTGIGDGIAIPHVRNPVVLNVTRPSITLCFLATPVEFGAIDNRPVHTVFSMVSPHIGAHLYLLSCLSSALHDARFKDAIVSRAPRDEVIAEARRVDGQLRPPRA